MIKSLVDIFAGSFYKKYAKQFFIGFCLLLSYFLFIQIAGVFLKNTRDYWSLFLSLSIGSEPLFIGLYWIFSISFMVFGKNHVCNQIRLPENDFLRFTLNCLSLRSRWSIWLIIISIINSPIILYCIYSTCISYLIQGNLTGLLSVSFLSLITIIEIYLIDNFAFSPKKTLTQKSIPKFFSFAVSINSIKLYNIIRNNLSVLLVVKFSGILVIYVFTNLTGLDLTGIDIKASALLAIILASFSSIILYKDYLFDGTKMIFSLNFPHSKLIRYMRNSPLYLILLIPELTLLWINLNFFSTLMIALILLALLLVIRSIIYCIGNHSMNVIKAVSIYFFIAFFFILYNYFIPFLFFSILISIPLFCKYYQCENQSQSGLLTRIII